MDQTQCTGYGLAKSVASDDSHAGTVRCTSGGILVAMARSQSSSSERVCDEGKLLEAPPQVTIGRREWRKTLAARQCVFAHCKNGAVREAASAEVASKFSGPLSHRERGEAVPGVVFPERSVATQRLKVATRQYQGGSTTRQYQGGSISAVLHHKRHRYARGGHGNGLAIDAVHEHAAVAFGAGPSKFQQRDRPPSPGPASHQPTARVPAALQGASRSGRADPRELEGLSPSAANVADCALAATWP
jgi:hypothetical protein